MSMTFRRHMKGKAVPMSQQGPPREQDSASGSDQQDTSDFRRIVVLVPSQGVDQIALARKVWALAAPPPLKVIFLGVERRASQQDTGLRLRLITLASMTRDEQVEVETHIEPGGNWVRAVRRVWQPGDIVIGHEGQRVWLPGYGAQPLNQVIEAALGIPVFMLTGVYSGERSTLDWSVAFFRRAPRLLLRTLPLFIICAFLYMQVRIDLTTAGFMRTTLLAFVAVTALGLLGAWAVLNR
jgi:hypothetical protein